MALNSKNKSLFSYLKSLFENKTVEDLFSIKRDKFLEDYDNYTPPEYILHVFEQNHNEMKFSLHDKDAAIHFSIEKNDQIKIISKESNHQYLKTKSKLEIKNSERIINNTENKFIQRLILKIDPCSTYGCNKKGLNHNNARKVITGYFKEPQLTLYSNSNYSKTKNFGKNCSEANIPKDINAITNSYLTHQ